MNKFLLRAGPFALLLAGALACGGGGTDPDPQPKPQPKPDPVPTSITVAPGDPSLPDGSTRQLTATVKDQDGAVMATLPSGTAVGWVSRDGAVASVDANGLVTALRPGTAWIRASVAGAADSTRVTVTAVPASIVVVGSPDRTGTVGRLLLDSLAVRVTDRHGTGMAGVSVAFAAAGGGEVTPAAVVTGADGTARAAWRLGSAPGEQGATAAAAGLAGSPVAFRATATPPVPAGLSVTPVFATIAVGATQAFAAAVVSTEGDPIPGAAVAYASTAPGVAQVSGAAATGAAPGVARIVASLGALADTSTVAVLGAGSILATAFPGAALEALAQRGDTVRVPVVLDLSRPSPTGDLGSVQLDVLYESGVLQLVRVDDELSGSVGHLRAAGRYSIAFAASQPQGTGTVRLATLVLVVRADAQAGAAADFAVQVTEAPRTTTFNALGAPVVVGGRVRIR